MKTLIVALVLGLSPATVNAPTAYAPGVVALPGWRLPVVGPVTRAFDPPDQPWLPGHRGVDIANVPGATIVAAGAGTVFFAGYVAQTGVVSIQHPDGLRTTYEPVVPLVVAGQPVALGTPIGTLVAGHAGCPVDACLHWGLLRGEEYLDPLYLVRPLHLRLKPTWPT